MNSKILTHNLGYPRIGEQRELKKALEAFWKGKISEAELHVVGKQLRAQNWKQQQEAGVDFIPSNDFSFYDQMLDTACMVGAIPQRFGWDGGAITPELYFKMARGSRSEGCSCHSGQAMEMTKWFDTNYHYIVPELEGVNTFRLSSTKAVDEFEEAKALGVTTVPVLIGPVTFLMLGKGGSLLQLDALLPVYVEVLNKLHKAGADWIQLDEPVFSLDLTGEQQTALQKTYEMFSKSVQGLKLLVATYFGELRENLSTFMSLPVAGLHYDAVRGVDEVETFLKNYPHDKVLSLGVVDGRNIWRNEYAKSVPILKKAQQQVRELWIAPSCSLLHSPVTLNYEKQLDVEIKSWMAFAEEKLQELSELKAILEGDESLLEKNREIFGTRQKHKGVFKQEVRIRSEGLKVENFERRSRFTERQKLQREKYRLPKYPTTTIGSFPQTREIRAIRAKFKKGELSQTDYNAFLKTEIERAVRLQEEIGIDVLVHGEFERNDMVEYFGEQLDGYVFTENGWVQSYGSRCVKPPVIYGDVARPKAMTVEWSSYAQSLTCKPMKGMLTGPITVLQWSFVRDDLSRREVALQLALAIRDEVCDLEKAGIGIIQIDEPALREGLPLRRADWDAYLQWAVDAFRLSASGVDDTTQIHTHMCYCEFNDIIDSIARLDADVISIETSRSRMELLEAFVKFKYPNEIGPGVYDIHSPHVPGIDEMVQLLRKAAAVLPEENLWVNPDCGLKTRDWPETIEALRNMVMAARRMRGV